LIAWLLGFARGLRSAGVPYGLAEVIVGTSAGAMVGSAVAPIISSERAIFRLSVRFALTQIATLLAFPSLKDVGRRFAVARAPASP
jgi:predicted acylesterase/phospholipase RssA